MVPDEITRTLAVTGEARPVSVVKAKQTIDDRDPGAVLDVQATDSGSLTDIVGWPDTTAGIGAVTAVQDMTASDSQLRI